MSITYDLTSEDYFNYQKWLFIQNGISKKLWIIPIITLLALYNATNNYAFNFLIVDGLKIPGDIIKDSFAFGFLYNLLLLASGVFLIHYLIIVYYKRHFSRSTHLNGHRELIIDDDRLILKRPDFCIDYRLKYLYSLKKISNYHILTFCDQSTILIPENTPGLIECLNVIKEKTHIS